MHSNVDEIPLESISNRPSGDTRNINFDHLFEIALSIHEVGLIEPIVVDRHFFLIAGAHRLWALKVLNLNSRGQAMTYFKGLARQMVGSTEFEKVHRKLDEHRDSLPIEIHYDFDNIPVRVYDFDSTQQIDQALQIEISENAQRRDYTSQEVFSLYQTLLTKGYTDQRGRPRLGEKPVKPMIATIIGQSVRTVKRKLDQVKARENTTPERLLREEVLKTVKSITRLNKILKGLSSELKAGICQSIEGRFIIDDLIETLKELDQEI